MSRLDLTLMCTVTVIPLSGGGFRLACNRDESRRRPAARPPIEVCLRRAWAVMPVDAVGGGTWVAASDRGLAFALLNYNPAYVLDMPAGPKSRGAVIPALLDCADVAAAVDRTCALAPADYGPFRLLVMGAGQYAEVTSGRTRVVASVREFAAGPILLTSSGLGDALVEPPRRELFEQTLAIDPSPDAQDAFHRHCWPDQLHLSVCMSRGDARTVSYTTVEASGGAMAMRYWSMPPNEAMGTKPIARSIARV
jgi:hypothetical protein